MHKKKANCVELNILYFQIKNIYYFYKGILLKIPVLLNFQVKKLISSKDLLYVKIMKMTPNKL